MQLHCLIQWLPACRLTKSVIAENTGFHSWLNSSGKGVVKMDLHYHVTVSRRLGKSDGHRLPRLTRDPCSRPAALRRVRLFARS